MVEYHNSIIEVGTHLLIPLFYYVHLVFHKPISEKEERIMQDHYRNCRKCSPRLRHCATGKAMKFFFLCQSDNVLCIVLCNSDSINYL